VSELVDRLKRAADDIALGTAFHNQMAVGLGRRTLNDAIAEIERLQTENTAMLAGAFAHDAACHYPEDSFRRVIEQMRDALTPIDDQMIVWPGYEWIIAAVRRALAAAEEALR